MVKKNFLSRASKVFKQLKAQGKKPKWPLSKEIVNSFILPKKQNPQENKKRVYSEAKQVYETYKNSIPNLPKINYVGSSIKYLNEYIEYFSKQGNLLRDYKDFIKNDKRETFEISRENFDLLAPLVEMSKKQQSSNAKKIFNHYIEFNKEKLNLTHTLPINFNLTSEKLKTVFSEEDFEGWEDSFINSIRNMTTSIDNIIIRKTINNTDRKKTKMGFFPYIINHKLILENANISTIDKIYKTFERYVSPIQDNDCFHYTLTRLYPDLSIIYKSLRIYTNGDCINLKDFPIIADQLKLYIKERHFTGKKSIQQRSKSYGDPNNPHLSVVIYKDHIFLDEDTTLTKSEVLSLFSTKKQPKDKKTLSSLNFIRLLMGYNYLDEKISNGYLIDIPSNHALQNVNCSELIIKGDDPNICSGVLLPRNQDHNNCNKKHYCSLDCKKECTRKCKDISMQNENNPIIHNKCLPKTHISLSKPDIIFLDFETYKNKSNKHKPYLCCASNTFNDDIISFLGKNCAAQFLDDLYRKYKEYPKDHKLYIVAHNAGYDFSFLIGVKGFSILSRIGNSTKNTKMADCSYYGRHFKFLDSCSFIKMKLEEFCENLKLKQTYKKGIFPYDAMTGKRFVKNSCNIEKAKIFIKASDINDFLTSIKDFLITPSTKKYIPKKFKITSYAEKYCKQDINILREGFIKYRQEMYELTKLDILDYCSLPGLTLEYVYSKGKLDNVPVLSGVIRQFIQQTIVGGRCQTLNNDIFSPEGEIIDKDWNSLYSSAYCYLEIPEGEPINIQPSPIHHISTKDLDNLYHWYFLEVEIITVRKSYKIANLSHKDKESGNRVWEDKPGTYFLNHIQLKDLCEYQQVTFINKGGVGWLKGCPTQNWKEFTEDLYNLRISYKKDRPLMADIIKGLLNAVYGRTLMKPITTKEKIFSDIEGSGKIYYEKYLNNNFDTITEITKYNGYDNTKCATVISKKSVHNHTSYNHIASVILAVSKSLMNSVIYLALDNDIDVYYTDTDSIFMPAIYEEKLADLYKQKYFRDIFGNDLQQMKSDYEKACPKGAKNIKCTKAIFLGKKFYCCELTYTLNEETHINYVAKLKGIPNECITYTLKKEGFNDEFELYRYLSKGLSIDFDLTLNNSKACFDVGKDFKFKTLNEFTRTIKI